MKEKLNNGKLKIEEYSFHEFLSAFQEAVLEGYSLDLSGNDTFPQKYGDYLSVVLVPKTEELPEELVPVKVDFQLTAAQQEILDKAEPLPLQVVKPRKNAKAV